MSNRLKKQIDAAFERLRKMQADRDREYRESTRIIRVDKTVHRVRFEDETEEEVVIVIEPKGEAKR